MCFPTILSNEIHRAYTGCAYRFIVLGVLIEILLKVYSEKLK